MRESKSYKRMTWINKIAFYQNIRNEVPNQELAKILAETENVEGIKEIADNLFDKHKSVASDCLKVLYEIGYLKPELIQNYVDTFLNFLSSKNNRMVWGSMIALATISKLKSDDIFRQINLVLDTIKKGTLITEIWGIKTLVGLSLVNDQYKKYLLPLLFDYLEECRPIDFATRVETLLPLIADAEENEIMDRIIKMKKLELSDAQAKKLKTILNRNIKNCGF